MTTKAETVKILWGSGFVNRWHTHPDPRLRNAQDTTAAHAQRVAVLVKLLGTWVKEIDVSDVRYQVGSAILHDAAEIFTGDVSYETQKRHADLRGSLAAAERWWWRSVGLPKPEMPPLVELCDHLDTFLFVKLHAPDLLSGDGWPEMIERDLVAASTLGIYDVVKALIYG